MKFIKNSWLIKLIVLVFMIFLVILFCKEFLKVERKNELQSVIEEVTEFNVAIPVSKVELIPFHASNPYTFQITNKIFDGLFEQDEKYGVSGKLVKEWKISDQGKKYDFIIRDDVYFHNNKQLVADDVVFSLNLCFKQKLIPSCSQFTGIQVEKTSNYSFTISLEKPLIILLELLTSPYIKIVPAGFAGQAISEFAEKPIGTGKFVFKSKDQDRIKLVRNEKHFKKKSNILQINYLLAIKEKRVKELIKEQKLHELNNIYPLASSMLKKTIEKKYNSFKYPSLKTAFLAFNFKKTIIQDKPLRIFIANLFKNIDLKYFADPDTIEPTTGFIPRGMKGHLKKKEIQDLNLYNRKTMKQAYQSLVIEKELKLKLVVPKLKQRQKKLPSRINDLLKNFPRIKINVVELSIDQYFKVLRISKDFDLTITVMSSIFMHPFSCLEQFYSNSKYNFSGVRDRFIDEQFKKIYNLEFDKIVLAGMEVDKHLLSHYYAVPLYYPQKYFYYPQNLQGIKPSILGLANFSYDKVHYYAPR